MKKVLTISISGGLLLGGGVILGMSAEKGAWGVFWLVLGILLVLIITSCVILILNKLIDTSQEMPLR